VPSPHPMRLLQLAVLALVALGSAAATNSSIDITIPSSVEVKGEDSYVCITRALPDTPLKLVGVEPMAQQEVVHHILLFGARATARDMVQLASSQAAAPGPAAAAMHCCWLETPSPSSPAGESPCTHALRLTPTPAACPAAPERVQAVTSRLPSPRTASRRCGSARASPHAAGGRRPSCERAAGLAVAAAAPGFRGAAQDSTRMQPGV
jgi:hypothetical protein